MVRSSSFIFAAMCISAAAPGSAFLAAPAASRAAAVGTRLMDAPEPLAAEGDWQAFLDEETTGLIYYFDTTTGESRWEPPTETFPPIKLPRRKQRVADELRRNYRKARQAQEGGAGAAVAEEEQAATGNGLFGGLFDDSSAAAVAEEPQVEKVKEEKEAAPQKQNFLGDMFAFKKKEPVAELVEKVAEEAPPAKRFFMKNIFSAPPAPTATQEKPIRAEEPDEQIFVAPEIPPPIKIEMSAYVLPHPDKMSWGGEDAVFTKGRTFGVFDGVSGADKLDGIPLYSKTLADEMKKMTGNDGLSIAEMSLFLTEAAEFADSCATGASTAVVASIGENGFLQALNLGDSCCIIIRNGRITARTREISHFFDCPYQLSEDSPDRPTDGTKLNVELIAGDIIVMGSDGIFDNLTDDEIVDTVNASPQRSSVIAKRVVDLSRKISLDPEAPTPYAKEAKKRRDPDYRSGLGGKLDDASCVVVMCK